MGSVPVSELALGAPPRLRVSWGRDLMFQRVLVPLFTNSVWQGPRGCLVAPCLHQLSVEWQRGMDGRGRVSLPIWRS